MSDGLQNIIATKGRRKRIRVDIDEEGGLVVAENDRRSVVVLYNNGPNTAYGAETLAAANPDDGFPLKAGGGVVEDASFDAWYFSTDTGEAADIRGWEVERP